MPANAVYWIVFLHSEGRRVVIVMSRDLYNKALKFFVTLFLRLTLTGLCLS